MGPGRFAVTNRFPAGSKAIADVEFTWGPAITAIGATLPFAPTGYSTMAPALSTHR